MRTPTLSYMGVQTSDDPDLPTLLARIMLVKGWRRQRDTARGLGVDQGSISRWANGQVSGGIRRENAEKLAAAGGIDIGEVYAAVGRTVPVKPKTRAELLRENQELLEELRRRG